MPGPLPTTFQNVQRRARQQRIIDEQILTGAEAAALLHITRTTLYVYVRRGLLTLPFRRPDILRLKSSRKDSR